MRRLFRQLRHTLRFRAVIVGGASASKRKISTEYCPKTKAPFQVNLEALSFSDDALTASFSATFSLSVVF
uniref:hypothetical protein n=1 Tax=Alistipes shahii TaxID=328814 RepID=UPI003AB667ED